MKIKGVYVKDFIKTKCIILNDALSYQWLNLDLLKRSKKYKIMVKEYRKVSAEALGIKLTKMGVIVGKYRRSITVFWRPDKYANQREMIEKYLLKIGKRIYYSIEGENEIRAILRETAKSTIETENPVESVNIAFMEVFMKYMKTTK